MTLTWIATINALDGAAYCGLGYIDYKTVTGNTDEIKRMMRKKRLAFAKFSFMMAIVCLLLLDKPNPNCVVPLIIGSLYNAMKIGTQIGYNMTPDKFFIPRTFLAIYNLTFLIAIWYKMRKARSQKLDLEHTFFIRVDAVMTRMSNIFQD